MSQPVTLITGASSGIGRALALRLAARGTHLALLARGAGRLAETADAVRAAGGNVTTRAVDVTDATAMASAVREIEAEIGPIECLIANAGGGKRMPAETFDAAAFADTIDVNLGGFANAAAAVLPGMRARGRGQIVAIGSLAARLGLPGAGAYCAAKAGVARLAASLRVELAPLNIAVTLVEPGFVDTKGKRRDKSEGQGKRLGTTGTRRKPAQMSLDAACARIERAIDKRPAVAAFPLMLVVLTGLLRCLPPSVYNYVIRRVVN